MGQRYNFCCPECGYSGSQPEVRRNSGETTYGMFDSTLLVKRILKKWVST
jgi:hypothetical protein